MIVLDYGLIIIIINNEINIETLNLMLENKYYLPYVHRLSHVCTPSVRPPDLLARFKLEVYDINTNHLDFGL